MATVAGLFTSPARKSGVSTAHERVRALAGEDVQAWEIGRQVRAGEALFEITMVCDPCHRMDELRDGLREQLDGKRGMLARVVESGEVAVGDPIQLV